MWTKKYFVVNSQYTIAANRDDVYVGFYHNFIFFKTKNMFTKDVRVFFGKICLQFVEVLGQKFVEFF